MESIHCWQSQAGVRARMGAFFSTKHPTTWDGGSYPVLNTG